MTPSEEVDEVWHQHLAYSRDYWQVWCRDVLRRDLHHGPTLGGPAESRRFAEQYAGTLAAYEAWFGPPPPDLWPGTAERFGRPRFHTVDRATHLAVRIPRRALARLRRLARALGLGAVLDLLSARSAVAADAAAALNPLDWTAVPFLALFVALACASLAAAMKAGALLRIEEPRRGGRSRLTPAELGFLAGGSGRAADVLILEDIATGRIALRVREGHFGPIPTRSTVISAHGQEVDRAWLISQRDGIVAELQRGLVDEGLILPKAHRRSIACATIALMGPVILLGLAKLALGTARDKPVGILTLLLVLTAVAAAVLAASQSHASRAGRALLDGYRAEHARALRAPRPEEAIAAFAVVGASALVGTAFEPYAESMKAADGGGCGGSGGDGGGCGGCGGGD